MGLLTIAPGAIVPDGVIAIAGDPTRTRVTGRVKCGQCPWVATMTGDTLTEVEVFLSKVFRAHLADAHPPAKDPS